MKLEGDELSRQLTEVWSDDVPLSLEMALLVNKVTHAILNPSEDQNFCLGACTSEE